jgi:acid phosphatase
MKRSIFLSVLVLLAVTATVHAQVPHSQHVVVVTLENHSYEQVIGNTAMPYFNKLATQYALADQYYSPQHNSLAALMWLTAGAQVTTNNSTPENFNVDHIARHVWQSGLTWKAYMSGLPSVGFTDYTTTSYMKRHVPFSYFTDVVTTTQKNNLVPLDNYFQQDIDGGTLPNFSYVVPDSEEDAHNGTLAMADTWLAGHIPQLLASPQFQKDGILFIVWDEGSLSPEDDRGSGGRVANLVIGKGVKNGYKSETYYTHQDLLHTVCEIMTLNGCPGNGQTGAAMSDFFTLNSVVKGATPRISMSSPMWNKTMQTNPVRIVGDIISDKPGTALIVYSDSKKVYQANGNHLDTKLDLPKGAHTLTIHAWDTAGRMMQATKNVTVIDDGVANPCTVNTTSLTVTICSAGNNAQVTNPVRVVAETKDEATHVVKTSVYVDGALQYLSYGRRVDTDLTLTPGLRHMVVRAIDTKSNKFESAVDVNVLASQPAVAPAVTATPSLFLQTPFDGSSASSPIHVSAKLLDTLPAAGMILYSDGQEVYRTYSGTMDTRVDLSSGRHQLMLQAVDNSGRKVEAQGSINVPDRIESCDEFKYDAISFCNSSTSNESAGAEYHLAAAARRALTTPTITTMSVQVDGTEKVRVYSNYVDAELKLTPGTHILLVQALDSNNQVIQGTKTVTIQ